MREPLDNLAKRFHYMWTHPLQWNPSRQKLEFNSTPIKHIPWICAVLFSHIPFVLVNMFLILSQLFGYTNLPFKHLIGTAIMLILSGFTLLLELISVAYGKDFAASFNALQDMEKNLRRQLGKFSFFIMT